MRTFRLLLRDMQRCEEIDRVESFVGADESGSFGIRPRHTPLIAALGFGLARFRCLGQDWRYLALPGAMLHFDADTLVICTRRLYLYEDYHNAAQALREQLEAEERALTETRRSVRELEQHMLKRLWQLRREGIKL